MSCDLRKCSHCDHWTPEMYPLCSVCGQNKTQLTPENIHEELAKLMDPGPEKVIMIHRPEPQTATYQPTPEELKRNDSRQALRKLKQQKGISTFSKSLFKR